MKLIGRMTVYDKGYSPNMQDAIDCDCEEGSPTFTEIRGSELTEKFPTVIAMARLIERERDQLKAKLKRLQKTKKP